MSVAEPQTSPLSLARLAALLERLAPEIVGDEETIVTHIAEDSRQAREGTLFVARKGEASDGTRFVASATKAGASAVLCERGAPVTSIPRIEVCDLREAWGIAAQALFDEPSKQVPVVGITGTNGKTTVASLVDQALRFHGGTVAKSGTLGFFVGEEKLTDSLTTPQPDQMAWALAKARALGAKAAVFEVSSHALDQKRVAGVQFEVGAFTNLTQDHLDYHETMEAYGEAKARLFREMRPTHQVLNIDDAFGAKLAAELPKPITTSSEGRDARLSASGAVFSRQGLEVTVTAFGEKVAFKSPLLGTHNLQNQLVAWGILDALGLSTSEIREGLSSATGVPGRLERCDGPSDDVAVVVDYAHTPDALIRALSSLSSLNYSEVVCLFGCGGDRDPGKRLLMGRAAAEQSDKIVVTSDNPRTEDPKAIIEQILPGLSDAKGSVEVVEDRRLAIARAVEWAAPGSVVLLAGKGHEDYQLVNGEVLPFDDRVEGRLALVKRRKRGQS